MKKILLLMLLLSTNAAFAVTPLDGVYGFTNIWATKTLVETQKAQTENINKQTDAYVETMKAQAECIKSGKCTMVNTGGQTIDPNSREAQMGLKMAEAFANHYERKNAKAKLKEIKNVAKIENDTQTLELIKKYKKAGAVITLQKIEEAKQTK